MFDVQLSVFLHPLSSILYSPFSTSPSLSERRQISKRTHPRHKAQHGARFTRHLCKTNPPAIPAVAQNPFAPSRPPPPPPPPNYDIFPTEPRNPRQSPLHPPSTPSAPSPELQKVRIRCSRSIPSPPAQNEPTAPPYVLRLYVLRPPRSL